MKPKARGQSRGGVKGLSVSRVGVSLGPEFSLCLSPGNEVTFCVNQAAPPSYAQTHKHHQSEISGALGGVYFDPFAAVDTAQW